MSDTHMFSLLSKLRDFHKIQYYRHKKPRFGVMNTNYSSIIIGGQRVQIKLS
jgi:hypothetical protein